jgi:chromosome segregation ATPase
MCAAVQMDGVKRDSARVINENNQLHVQLIREAEKYDAQQTKHYQKVKSLEGEIAELSFWKHQALNRMDASEKEVASLKGRLQELMKLGAPIRYRHT